VSDGANTDNGKGRYISVPLECVGCRTVSVATAWRWRSDRIDDPTEDEEPALAFDCPFCAEREFGSLRNDWGHESGHEPGPGYHLS
jgi:hypothetical protein